MNILIAEIMTAFRDLVNHAAAPVDNTASTGQTGYSSMALEIMMSGIVHTLTTSSICPHAHLLTAPRAADQINRRPPLPHPQDPRALAHRPAQASRRRRRRGRAGDAAGRDPRVFHA